MKVLAVDTSLGNDQTILNFGFTNTCLEEVKKLWKIGDEYPLPENVYKRYGLKNTNKLIIVNIYNGDNEYNDIVYMNLLVK